MSLINWVNCGVECCTNHCPDFYKRVQTVCNCSSNEFIEKFSVDYNDNITGFIAMLGLGILVCSYVGVATWKNERHKNEIANRMALDYAKAELASAKSTLDPKKIREAKIALRLIEQTGKLEEVRKSIREGRDLDSKLPEGGTLLQRASGRGDALVVAELLKAGATIDLTDERGQTALHRACVKGQIDVARSLVNQGSSLTARDVAGQTPLLLLMQSGYEGDIVFLIDRDDINRPNKARDIPLHVAAIAANPTWIQALLEAGADPTMMDSKGQNALARLLKGQLPVQAFVNKYFVDCSEKEKSQHSKMVVEAFSNLNLKVRLLGEKFVRDVAKKVSPGSQKIALSAVRKDPYYCMEFKQGEKDKRKISLVGVALARAGRLDNALLETDYAAVEKCMKLLLEKVDPNQYSQEGIPLLHEVMRTSNKGLRMTQMLLASKKINLDKAIDLAGNTAAHVAVEMGVVEALHELKIQGVDLTRPNNAGVNPLQKALEKGHEGCIRLLLKQYDSQDLARMSIEGLSLIEYALLYSPPGLRDALNDAGIFLTLNRDDFPRLEKALMGVWLADLKVETEKIGINIKESNILIRELEEAKAGRDIPSPSEWFDKLTLGIRFYLESVITEIKHQKQGTHIKGAEVFPVPFGDYLSFRKGIGELLNWDRIRGITHRMQNEQTEEFRGFFKEEQAVSSLALLAKTYALSHADMPIGSKLQNQAIIDYFDIYHVVRGIATAVPAAPRV